MLESRRHERDTVDGARSGRHRAPPHIHAGTRRSSRRLATSFRMQRIPWPRIFNRLTAADHLRGSARRARSWARGAAKRRPAALCSLEEPTRT